MKVHSAIELALSSTFVVLINLVLAVGVNGQSLPVVRVESVVSSPVNPILSLTGNVHSRALLPVTAGIDAQLSWIAEPGDRIAKGEDVVRFNAQPLRLLQAEQQALIARDQIQLSYLNRELKRMQSLHKRKNVSEDELEEVQSRRDIAQQELAVARARLAIIEERLGRTRVTSPFNGIVVERNHREGEDVSRGDELLKLQQADQLELRLFVPVKHLASLAPGQQVAVFRQKARGNKVAANIRSIVPSADSRSQTVEVRIDLKQDGGLNWIPGELLRAEIGLPAETGQLAVPRDAILIRSSGTFVVVIDDQKMAHRIAVQLGRAKDQWINIRSDSEYLKAGNHVAVRGAERLNQGQQVTIGNS